MTLMIKHGKSIDIQKLKQPVLDNLSKHVQSVKTMIQYLSDHEKPILQDKCYICGSKQRSFFSTVHAFDYLQCQSCGHVYTERRYSAEALQRFYQKTNYYSQITYANKQTCEYRRANVARPKVEFVEKFSSSRTGLWVDVGSGIGDIPSVAKENGWDAVGLELSESSVAFAKETFGISLVTQTLEDFVNQNPALHGQAEIVSLIGIIEHVTDPLKMLEDASRLLKKGGLAMVQVPNAASFSTEVQKVFPDNVFRHMNPVDHIMLFTRKSLEKSLEINQLEPVAHWFHGLDIYELLTNLILTNPKVQNSGLEKLFYSLMNPLQLVIDQNELSNSLICVSRKK